MHLRWLRPFMCLLVQKSVKKLLSFKEAGTHFDTPNQRIKIHDLTYTLSTLIFPNIKFREH